MNHNEKVRNQLISSVLKFALNFHYIVLVLFGVLLFAPNLIFIKKLGVSTFLKLWQLPPFLLRYRVFELTILPHSIFQGISQDGEASSYSKLLSVVPITFKISPIFICVTTKSLFLTLQKFSIILCFVIINHFSFSINLSKIPLSVIGFFRRTWRKLNNAYSMRNKLLYANLALVFSIIFVTDAANSFLVIDNSYADNI